MQLIDHFVRAHSNIYFVIILNSFQVVVLILKQNQQVFYSQVFALYIVMYVKSN
jgi:hypothetical protein